MKKKIGLIILFILLVALATFHSFSFTNLYSFDEIWNYGFGKNILDGLVPYRDFNMIVTPLYSFLGSGMIQIFGEYLCSLHILDAILVASMMVFLFKMIGFRSFLVYPFIILWAIPSYNLLCFPSTIIMLVKFVHYDYESEYY